LTPNVSPLRQRTIGDMRMRKFNGKNQIHYIRAVRRLAAFLRRSPDTATAEELRAFQLHMVDTGTAPPTINSTLSGLKFFFDVTLGLLRAGAPPSPAARVDRLRKVDVSRPPRIEGCRACIYPYPPRNPSHPYTWARGRGGADECILASAHGQRDGESFAAGRIGCTVARYDPAADFSRR
jgi:hypothetical protein